MLRPEKAQQVDELIEKFKSAPSLAVTNYQGLTVEAVTNLRSGLRAKNIGYLVAKNTLLRIAAREAGIEGLEKHLIGPTAIAFGTDDPGAMAKLLFDFAKDNNRDRPEVRAVMVEGKIYAGADAKQIAALPTKEELQAQIVGLLMAPMRELVTTFDNVIRELVGTVEAMKEKAES
jgi:large subunit ribosomal protein L10